MSPGGNSAQYPPVFADRPRDAVTTDETNDAGGNPAVRRGARACARSAIVLSEVVFRRPRRTDGTEIVLRPAAEEHPQDACPEAHASSADSDDCHAATA